MLFTLVVDIEKWLSSILQIDNLIIQIMDIYKCYFSTEHITLLFEKNWCEHKIRKINRLKELCMMQDNICNEQFMSINQDKA